MIRFVPALLSVAVSLGAAFVYLSLLRVPVIRNHPALYLAGVAIVAALLVYEQSLVSDDDLSQVKKAFDLNGWVGIVYFTATALALYVG